jgi:hypothetical protein
VFDRLDRRGYLGGVVAGIAALAGCNEQSEPTETDEPTRETTEPSATASPTERSAATETTATPPVSHDHSGPDAGGADLDPATVTTEQFRNAVGEQSIQAAFDGLVVPVGEGVGMDAAVDPTATDTPIQDAIDVVGTGRGRANYGAVLLPPGRIEETGSLTGTRGKSFVGWGVGGTTVTFTALDEPGITQDPTIRRDAAMTYWDGITFEGGAGAKSDATRTAPAIHLRQSDRTPVPDDIRGFNVGHVRFQDWGDPVVHLDGATLFESHWTWVDMNSFNNGRNVLIEDTAIGGSSWTVDKLNMGRPTPGRLFDARTAGGGRLHVQNLHFRDNEPGSADVPVIDIDTTTNGQVTIAQLEYEAAGADLPTVIRLAGGGRYRLGQLQFLAGGQTGGGLSVDHLVELQRPMDVEIGQFDRNGTVEIREGVLGIVGDQPAGSVRFYGTSDQVHNAVGSRRGRVFALEDRRIADPLYRDTVTHPTGETTRIRGVNRAQTGTVIGSSRRRFTPRVQRLHPTTMPGVSYAVDHRFEWRTDDDYERWDLVLEWIVDPGRDLEFEVAVTRRGTGH